MVDAQCACGTLRLTFSEPPQLTALCHCFACQRRTGAPFSANAFYPIDCVEISGPSTEFIRIADSGRNVRMHFCPLRFDGLLEGRCLALLDRCGRRLVCLSGLRRTDNVGIRTIETRMGAS